MSRSVTSFSKMRTVVFAVLAVLSVAPVKAEVRFPVPEGRWIPAFAGMTEGAEMTDGERVAGIRELSLLSINESMHLSLNQPISFAMAGDEFDTAPKSNAAALPAKNKSLLKAGLYSALLPGLGQRYVGSPTKMKVLMGVEIGLWLGFASYKVYEG